MATFSSVMDNLISFDDFVYFPLLPQELRNMIWKLSLPGPRYIEIRSVPSEKEERLPSGERRPIWKPYCKEPVPATFFACRESHSIVRDSYQPFRGTDPQSETVFFDFSKDILCLTDKRFTTDSLRPFVETLDAYTLNNLRHLILDIWTFMYPDIGRFKNLETLWVGAHSGTEYEDCEKCPEGCDLEIVGFNNYLGSKEKVVLNYEVMTLKERGLAERNNFQCSAMKHMRGRVESHFSAIKEKIDPKWKQPLELKVGQCIFSEHPGLDWEFFDNHWQCSLDPKTFIPITSDYGISVCANGGRNPNNERVIETPAFKYRYTTRHFPCPENQLVVRGSAEDLPKSLLDTDNGTELSDWIPLTPDTK